MLGKLSRSGYLVELELDVDGPDARAMICAPAPHGTRIEYSLSSSPAQRVRIRICTDSGVLAECDDEPMVGTAALATQSPPVDGANAALLLTPIGASTQVIVRAARVKALHPLDSSDRPSLSRGGPTSQPDKPLGAGVDAFAMGREFTGSLKKDSDTFPCTARVTASNSRSIELSVSEGTFVTAWTIERDGARLSRCASVQLVARGHRNLQSLRDVVTCGAAFDGTTLRATVRWTEVWKRRKPRFAVALELRPRES